MGDDENGEPTCGRARARARARTRILADRGRMDTGQAYIVCRAAPRPSFPSVMCNRLCQRKALAQHSPFASGSPCRSPRVDCIRAYARGSGGQLLSCRARDERSREPAIWFADAAVCYVSCVVLGARPAAARSGASHGPSSDVCALGWPERSARRSGVGACGLRVEHTVRRPAPCAAQQVRRNTSYVVRRSTSIVQCLAQAKRGRVPRRPLLLTAVALGQPFLSSCPLLGREGA